MKKYPIDFARIIKINTAAFFKRVPFDNRVYLIIHLLAILNQLTVQSPEISIQ